MLAGDLDLLSQDAHGELHARVVEIKKMLTAFHRTLAG